MSRSVRIFWKLFFAGFLAFALLLLLIYLGVFGKLPSLSELENPSLSLASEVYGDDGTLLGKYYTEKGNRSYVKFKDISPYVVDALISTEDKRFYRHSGIDGTRLVKAVITLGSDGGASTITQQLAKNMLEQGSSNKLKRIVEKLKEWIVAVELERQFTKQEILSLYLNTVSFSDNVYGIRNAARTFFSREPDQLSVEEAAVLVGMLKATGTYNPRINPRASMERRNTIIDLMAGNHYLSATEAVRVKKLPIRLNYKKINENNGMAPYFLDVIRGDLKKWCREHKNAQGQPYNLFTDGLQIYTTINPRMQIDAEEAVSMHLPVLQRALDRQWSIRKGIVWKGHRNILEAAMKNSDRWQNLAEQGMPAAKIRKTFFKKVRMKVFAWNPDRETDTLMTPYDSIKYNRQMLQTAFMVMDPLSGQVKAWVGGIDFKHYKYDHVNVDTKRQVGSSIKPFLYALAMDQYGFTPQTQCEATQQYFPGSGYVPATNSGSSGTRTLATGLAFSINEVAAYLIKQTTPERFARFLGELDIPTRVRPYPSISLGTCDLSLFEMMWGYTIFPTGGFSTKPVYFTRIEDKNGNVLATFDTKRKEVISQSTAYTMCRMMQGTVDIGTAAGLRERLGVSEMGGKTGTTNDYSDAWFIGYTPQLEAGVWIGCDDPFIHLQGGLGVGGRAAAPIWESFFRKAFADRSLGLDRHTRFVEPADMRPELVNSIMDATEQSAPPGPGAEPAGSNAYDRSLATPDKQYIPSESRLSLEEQKVLDEANGNEHKKKKRGFFRRLFGRKDRND